MTPTPASNLSLKELASFTYSVAELRDAASADDCSGRARVMLYSIAAWLEFAGRAASGASPEPTA